MSLLYDDELNVEFTFNHQNTGLGGYNVSIDGNVISGSPFAYLNPGPNHFTTSLAADGQAHDLLIQDVDDPNCQLDTIFTMPSCDDPCLGFEALFVEDIDHQSLEVQFFCQSPGVTAWNWNFGDGQTGNIQNPVNTYSEEGTYEVCVDIENADGCTAAVCDSITVGIDLCQAIFDYENDGLTVSFSDLSGKSRSMALGLWRCEYQ